VRKFILTLLASSALFAASARAQEILEADAEEAAEESIDEGDGGFVPDDELDQYEDYSEYDEADAAPEGTNERVKYFDVAGVMLGQDYKEARKALKERKYRLSGMEYKIPEYFSFNYDAICRSKNLLVPDTLAACIKGLAKKDKMEYLAKASFKRADTNEDIDIYFTSPLTENKVWKIEYKNDVDKKYGDAKNFQYQRDERRRAFWHFAIMKYGEPNMPPNQWVMDPEEEFPTSLTAGFGTLVLTNAQQNAFDILETEKEARRQFKYKEYSF
jgi:hypothetical protein